MFWKSDGTSVIPPHNSDRHLVLHATVTDLGTNTVRLSKAFPNLGVAETGLSFDYLVYALGSQEPEPIDLWGSSRLGSTPYDGTKSAGIKYLKSAQERIKEAHSVLVVGGGALGIRESLQSQ